jgi:tetratricopeptide (TPR) repeat protein
MIKLTHFFVAAALLAVVGVQASGETLQRDVVREKAILDRLGKVAPKAVKNFESGTAAMDGQDYSAGAKFYALALGEAPDSNPAIRRLGICLVSSGQYKPGVELLEQALKQERSPENLYSLAAALAYPGSDVKSPREDKVRALDLAMEARRSDPDDLGYLLLVAHLSGYLESYSVFKDATAVLVKEHPDLMETHFYNAIRAEWDEQWVTAEAEIRTAGKMGLPQEDVEKFLDDGVRSKAAVWHYAFYSLYLVGAWILGLVLLFGFGKGLSSLTLRSIELDDPNDGDNRKHVMLRKCYRTLIGACGVYYYVSVPMVIFLLLAGAGSVIYAFGCSDGFRSDC